MVCVHGPLCQEGRHVETHAGRRVNRLVQFTLATGICSPILLPRCRNFVLRGHCAMKDCHRYRSSHRLLRYLIFTTSGLFRVGHKGPKSKGAVLKYSFCVVRRFNKMRWYFN